MSRLTTNYGYNISEGSDLVNPLVDIFPNWEAIDGDLKNVSDDAVGRATELTTGTVHALTRSDTDRNVFVFTATSNFTAGDTFTLDGTQVSALTPAGEQLATGCYIIGSDVLVAVHGTLMTMYVSPTKVADSDKLDGHDSTYFATASGVSDLSDDLDGVSDKVGTGVLTTTAQDCVGAINELNSDLSGNTSSITMSPSGVIDNMTSATNSLVKVGCIVTLNFFTPTGNTNAIPNNVWHTIGTLPTDFRPSLNEIRVRASTRSGDGNIIIALYSTGEVKLLTSGVGLGAQVGLAFDVSYPV